MKKISRRKKKINLKSQLYYYGVLTIIAISIPLALYISIQSGGKEQDKTEADALSLVNLPSVDAKNNEATTIDTSKNSTPSTIDKAETIDSTEQVVYSVKNPPSFFQSQDLDWIVEEIVNKAQQRGLPTEHLSISLVNLNQPQCCGYASYQDEQSRYPASVVKLFWLIALFHQNETGILKPEAVSQKDLSKMIQDSDNEAASRVLDKVTDTESSKVELPPEALNEWFSKRDQVNKFFNQADFKNININQKTFPIPYLDVDGPEGADYQIRFLKPGQTQPTRNALTTRSMARLLVDIDQNKAVSPDYMGQVKFLLKRDLNPSAWQDIPYNAINNFLGEGLPPETEFYSKMGWTFNNRNDAAIIKSPDQNQAYVLVIFGDHKAFYEDEEFLPMISKFVYERMATASLPELPSLN